MVIARPGIKSSLPMKQLLMDHNLVTTKVMQQCDNIHKVFVKRSRIIHSLGQPFELSFERQLSTVILLTKTSCQSIVLRHLFTHSVVSPFRGNA